MTIFITVLLIMAAIAVVFSLVYEAKTTKEPKYSMSELLCAYIRENRAIYGICDCRLFMDSTEDVKVISPQELGL